MTIDQPFYADGYPALAAFIASDTDGSTAIFKRFNRLAARNLLLLQAELASLQEQLDAFDDEDTRDLDTLQSLRNWDDYKARRKNDQQRMELVSKIRGTLREYREAMIFESTLARLPPPERKAWKAFRLNFFHGPSDDVHSFPMLGGSSASLYDDQDDLVQIHATQRPDRLTSMALDNFGFLFKDESRNANVPHPRISYASGRKIERFVAWFSTLLAAVLLVGAIVALYAVDSDKVKLGLIALFTTIFAASVGLLTNAKRSEIFGATAAYAAVLVVFVSGELGGS